MFNNINSLDGKTFYRTSIKVGKYYLFHSYDARIETDESSITIYPRLEARPLTNILESEIDKIKFEEVGVLIISVK